MRPLFSGCTTLAATLVLACNDATSPTPAAEAVSPPLSASVTRFTDGFFDFVFDDPRSLAAMVGLDHEQLPAFCSGEEVSFDQVRIVEVIRPDGSVKITFHGKPRVTVYSTAGVSDICELAAATPLATGRLQVTGTDNDVAVSLNRTNSFGRSLVGTASGSGGRFKVRGSFRITIQRNGNFLVRHEEFSIRPLGR